MRLGRLFWKFFFFFWMAQSLTAAGVGLTIWLTHPDRPPPHARAERPPLPPPGTGDFRPPPPPPERGLRPPLLPLLAGSVVSLLFAALLAWYFSRPIRSLRDAFDAVAAGRLTTRIGAGMGRRQDELADLGQDFDRMAERLERLIEGQRRWLHDISHELRSPLARLQAASDLLRQQPERAAEFAERIDRDTGRMDRLVGELLTLARLDAGLAGRFDETVELAELLAGIADDAAIEGEARGCRIELAATGPLAVRGSTELLQRAVENVVRNALRHSPAGGRIAISAQRDGPRVRVAVADDGAGVPEELLERIFDPFFRADDSRAFAGHGLGLSIARRVIEAHSGRIAAGNRPAGGLAVAIDLPAA